MAEASAAGVEVPGAEENKKSRLCCITGEK